MSLYVFLIWLTGFVGIGSAVVAYMYTRDIFHPAVFLGPMVTFSYCFTPLLLEQGEVIGRLLPPDYMPTVQFIYLVGAICLCGGALLAGRPTARLRRQSFTGYGPRLRNALRRGGIVLGGAGALAFVYTVVNVGGLEQAYGTKHSQGWAASGYIREARFWIVPGLCLIWMACIGRRLQGRELFWLGVIALPLVFHGVFSAARGPTFMALVTLVGGWYVIRNRRPAALTFVAGSLIGALIILALVTNRGSIYYGGEFEFRGLDAITSFVGRESQGNEYIYGSGTIISALETGEYQWGGLYVLRIVVRAIPRAIWPTQYEDTKAFFGLPDRMQVVTEDALGWQSTGGASMGMIGDLWLQFWVLTFPLLAVVGYAHGAVWRRAMARGGPWLMVFIVMLSLTIFLTQQTLQSMLFRFLFLGGSGWLTWKLLIDKAWRAERRALRHSRMRAGMSREVAGVRRLAGPQSSP